MRSLLGDQVVDLHRLGDDVADRHARVQRGVGVLEDHLQVAAHLAHLATVELRQVLALEDHLAGGRLVELQDGATGRGLAATGLAHQTERLTLLDVEGDAVDGLDRADLALEDDPLGQREVHHQVLDLEQRLLPLPLLVALSRLGGGAVSLRSSRASFRPVRVRIWGVGEQRVVRIEHTVRTGTIVSSA